MKIFLLTLITCVLFLADSSATTIINVIMENCKRETNLLEKQMTAQLVGEQFVNTKKKPDLAEDSDYDKKIRSADSRAMRQKFKGRGRGTPNSTAGFQAQLPTIGFGGTSFSDHPMYVTGVSR